MMEIFRKYVPSWMFDRVLNTPLGWVINKNKTSVVRSRLIFLSKETRVQTLPSDQTQAFLYVLRSS